MASITFTCNSLLLKHWFQWPKYLFWRRKKREELFKKLFADFLSVKPEQVFLFGAGRMGLYTLLKALQLSANDEVIVCGYTCVVVTNAIKYTGASIKYVDISHQDLNIDTDLLRQAITDRTRVVVVPHNFGIVYEDIEQLKQEYPLLVFIEDAAHCMGSVSTSGKLAGTIADASFFSMEFSKPITTGMGGVLVVNNPQLLEPVKELYADISYPTKWEVFRIFITLKLLFFTSYRALSFLKIPLFALFNRLRLTYRTSDGELSGDFPPHYPQKISSLLLIFGILQLKDIERINRKKQQICATYYHYFSGIKGIKMINDESYVMVRFPIWFEGYVSQQQIDAIKKDLLAHKIYFGEWFNAVVHPAGSFAYGYSSGQCVVGEQLTHRIINLPVNVNHVLSTKQLDTIQNIFKTHLS